MTHILNTKVLLSGAMIVAAAAVVIGATFAFFSDTETSTGNVLAAGQVDLKIDSDCSYTRDGVTEECVGFGTWDSTDLTTERFYDFVDVKPGDWGENTISLLVDNNDAWACMRIDNMQNLENELIDPESEAGDVTDPEGELAENIHFTAWLDQGETPGWQGDDEGEGDNIWQGEETEPLLFSNISGPASDVLGGVTYPLAEPGGSVIEANTTNYIGLLWCAGDLTVNTENSTINCDGSTMGNDSQTDTLSADISFYAEQSRNNEGFSCANVSWPLPEASVTPNTTWSAVDLEGGFEWFAKARNNNGGFEVAVGTDANTVLGQDTADTTWAAGASNPFTLYYDGNGEASLTAGGQTVAYTVGDQSYTRLGINIKAPDGVTTSVDSLSLDVAAPLSPDNWSVLGSGNTVNSLLITGIDLGQAWTLTGSFTFSAVGTPPYAQEYPAIQFSID